MWRACRNSLPTKENLVRRTVIECPTCDRCKHVPESALHAMWSCRELDVVWENDAQWQCRRTQTFVDFKELLSWLIINHRDLKFFCTMAWLIWTQRNWLRLNIATVSTHQIAATARELTAEFAQSITSPLLPRVTATPPQTRWRPPHLGLVKINCDGATFKEQNKSGVGVVIRDGNGLVLASLAKQITQLYTALEVEAMAAATALSFAAQLGFHSGILESDSLLLVSALIENHTYLSTDGLLLDDIRFYASFFNQLLYSHVKREGNKVAHRLAKHALCISDFLVWMEDVPPPIRSVVQDDMDGFY